MTTETCGKVLLQERSIDPEVFQDMDKFELNEAGKFALSIRLQFPKFSKGFSAADFAPFIKSNIGVENLVAIGRLSFPNEWQIQVKSKQVREDLIRMGRTKINTRTCWISPLSQSEVRGYVHWIPNAIDNKTISEILQPYGEVLFFEIQKNTKWTKVDSDSRYFAMNLKPGQTMDDIPHFFKIGDHHGLITIRGRSPSCFHCREVGHRKSECKKFREKLNSYCLRKPHPTIKRKRPRGKRYRPVPNENEDPESLVKTKGQKAQEMVRSLLDTVNKEKPSASKASKKKPSTPSTTAGVSQLKNNPVAKKEIDNASKLNVQEVLEQLGITKNLEALQNLSSVLSTTATTWNTEIEMVKKKLSSPLESCSVKAADGSENPEQASQEKKKKRKKKKKKNAATGVTGETGGDA